MTCQLQAKHERETANMAVNPEIAAQWISTQVPIYNTVTEPKRQRPLKRKTKQYEKYEQRLCETTLLAQQGWG